MPAMKFEQIMSELKNRIYHPVYFLFGDEPYYIDEISNFIEDNVLEEAERDFNQTIAYGRDVDAESIISMAKRFPMMASHQVVIIKEAQNITQLADLTSYLENPLESTILVLHYKYKKVDKRKKIFQVLKKHAVFFESPKMYDNKMSDWINNYVLKKGYRITPKAAMMLTEFLGVSLSKVVNEVNKIVINLEAGSEINDAIVEQFIGISKDFNYFEFQNAIGRKDVYKANQIAMYFGANIKENPFILTLMQLYSFFSKLMIFHQIKDKSKNSIASELGINPFFVKDYQIAAGNYSLHKLARIMGYLKEYDLKVKGIKGGNTSEGELMKELLFKILH